MITILRWVGPVISTRRSCRSCGAGATDQSLSRISRVSSRKSSVPPASSSAGARPAAAEARAACGSNSRCRPATNSSASGVSTSSMRPLTGACISMPFTSTPAIPGASLYRHLNQLNRVEYPSAGAPSARSRRRSGSRSRGCPRRSSPRRWPAGWPPCAARARWPALDSAGCRYPRTRSKSPSPRARRARARGSRASSSRGWARTACAWARWQASW